MEGMEVMARKRSLTSQIQILREHLILQDLLFLRDRLILCDLHILLGHRMLQYLQKEGKDESQQLISLS
jgi:ribosomal protein S15P/S13E